MRIPTARSGFDGLRGCAGHTPRWVACVVAATWLGGCSLLARGPEPVTYPAANRRPINPYGELPGVPNRPLQSGEAALAMALRDTDLLRHVQRIDAKYSGRRRRSLAWTGQATFVNALADDPDPKPATEAEEGEAQGGAADRQERENEVREAIARAMETDGGYWRVDITSNVRETRIYYECELPFSTQGEPLVAFEARRACAWKDQPTR